MKPTIALSALAAAVLLSACATTTSTAPADADKEEKIYVTGSNLPQRDRKGVKTVDPERVQNDVQPGNSAGTTGSTTGAPR